MSWSTVATVTQPDRLDSWVEWLNGDLWRQVHDLVNQYLVFGSWNEIVGLANDASKEPGWFHRWIVHNYQDSLASGVRRLSDTNPSTASFVRLLMEVERDAPQLTYEWWMSRAIVGLEDDWEKHFYELSDGHDHIIRAVVRADKERVVEACQRIKDYVNSHIAHLQRDRTDVAIPTFGDAHEAVLIIYEMFLKWFWVIDGASPAALRPPVRWEHTLAVPWIDEETAEEVAKRRSAEWDAELRDRGLLSD